MQDTSRGGSSAPGSVPGSSALLRRPPAAGSESTASSSWPKHCPQLPGESQGREDGWRGTAPVSTPNGSGLPTPQPAPKREKVVVQTC